jgi:hypothetical protein
MTGILRKQFRLYARQEVEVRRLALGLDQVLALDLPPNPAKESDSRYRKYVLATGQTDSWELDALSPTFIDELLKSAILDLIDHDARSEALAHEELGRDQFATWRSDDRLGVGGLTLRAACREIPPKFSPGGANLP